MQQAIEQSEQMKIPNICEPIKLEELLSRDQKDLITLVCSVEENSNSIRNVLKNNIASNYSLMVGPEGDFSETEMNNLKNKGNYFMVSL